MVDFRGQRSNDSFLSNLRNASLENITTAFFVFIMICGLSLNHWANSGGTEGHISGTTVMKTKPSIESSSSIRNPSNSYGIESSNESPTEPISYENYLERDFDDFSTAFSDYEDDFLFGEDDDMNNNFVRTTRYV